MYKKKLRRFDNYSKEDELETVFVRLKTKLDLLKEIKDIFKDNMDPTIQKQIKIAQQETRQDIKKLTDFGVSLVDIYSRIGGNIFKAEVLQANEYLQMVQSKQEDHVIDLVNEDQELLRQNQRRQQRLNALQDPVAWQQVQERRVYKNNPILLDKPKEESISLRSFLEGLNNEQEQSNEEENQEDIPADFQSANSQQQNIEGENKSQLLLKFNDFNDQNIQELLQTIQTPPKDEQQQIFYQQLIEGVLLAPTINGQEIDPNLLEKRRQLLINIPKEVQDDYQKFPAYLTDLINKMYEIITEESNEVQEEAKEEEEKGNQSFVSEIEKNKQKEIQQQDLQRTQTFINKHFQQILDLEKQTNWSDYSDIKKRQKVIQVIKKVPQYQNVTNQKLGQDLGNYNKRQKIIKNTINYFNSLQ